MGHKALVSLKSWSESDIGRKRANNEDYYFEDPHLGLFMVADGMGGHRGGDQASKIAIEVAQKTYKTHIDNQVSPDLALKNSVIEAAKKVYQAGVLESSLRGMGTTLSALVIHGNQATIAHIGDTRIYCLRHDRLYQLTRDHSLVNDHVQAGLMTKEEARISSFRHIITRAIGHDEEVQPDYFTVATEKKDIFLLCTDGLNNMLVDNEIFEIIKNVTPKKAVKQLINEANKKGGDDNITVVLVESL